MIITRYLFKEVLSTMLVVLGILLLIFISNEFIRYLSTAASGKISSMTVLKIMAMQVPFLAGLLLPAALFVGFLLAYGRMYAESEMTVLTACGLSQRRLLMISLMMAALVLVADIVLTFYVSPKLLDYKNKLLAVSGPATMLQTVQPGKFMSTPDGKIVYYIEAVSRKHDKMRNLFVAQQDKKTADSPKDGSWNVTSAALGFTQIDPKNGEQWLIAENGYRYFGTPGSQKFRIIKFGQYGARIGVVMNPQKHRFDGIPTTQLWAERNTSNKAQAEWQWRVSVPLSVLVLTLLAVPLSRVRPRHGRYGKLLPSILIYAVYVNTMFVARGWLEDGKVPYIVGVWWLHIIILLIALGLWLDKEWLFSLFRTRKTACE